METLWWARRPQVGMRIPTSTCWCLFRARYRRDVLFGVVESATHVPLCCCCCCCWFVLRSESGTMPLIVASTRCTTHIGVAAAFGCNGFSPSLPYPLQLSAQTSCKLCRLLPPPLDCHAFAIQWFICRALNMCLASLTVQAKNLCLLGRDS